MMKLNVCCSETNIITLFFNDNNTLEWIQHTNATVVLASQIANKVSCLFPDYKLKTFSFVPSLIGGYNVEVTWKLEDCN